MNAEPKSWSEIHPLRQHREDHNLTLADIAGQVDTSPTTIFRIENRQNYPSAELLAKLVAATGLAAESFLPEVTKKEGYQCA